MKNCPINNAEDVRMFVLYIRSRFDLPFHPDIDFRDYINENTRQPTFTEKQWLYFNDVLTDCFRVCKLLQHDMYELSASVLSPDFA